MCVELCRGGGRSRQKEKKERDRIHRQKHTTQKQLYQWYFKCRFCCVYSVPWYRQLVTIEAVVLKLNRFSKMCGVPGVLVKRVPPLAHLASLCVSLRVFACLYVSPRVCLYVRSILISLSNTFLRRARTCVSPSSAIPLAFIS